MVEKESWVWHYLLLKDNRRQQYIKYHIFLYTKFSDKMVYIQMMQTQIRLLLEITVCHSSKYFNQQLHKKQILDQKHAIKCLKF